MPTYRYQNPPKEALAFFRSKANTTGFDYRDVWKQEHAQAFTVAKAMRMDVLTSIRSALDEALENGQTFAQFKKDLTPTLQKLGWWGQADMVDPLTGEAKLVQLGSPRRLETIYRMNMATARDAGRWNDMQLSKKTHPYLLYELGPSKEHRPEHVKWAGLMLPIDDPFWDTHYPRNGWGCNCHVRAISRREYERLKGTGRYQTQAPEIKYKEWVNKRTGEVEQIPEGITPGFNYNVGKARNASTLNHVNSKLAAAPKDLARPTVGELLKGPAFKQFYEKPSGNFPVAILNEGDVTAIGALTAVVKLSSETLQKQRKRHPELSAEEYAQLQQAIEQGRVVQDGSKNLIFIYEAAGYVAIVKATQTGEGVFATSFRRLSNDAVKRDKEVQRLLNKGK